MFAREADVSTEIQTALQNTVFFKVDCEKGEGIEVAKRYKVQGYPTFIAVNGQGEVTDRWIGYEGAAKWAASVDRAKADPRTIAAKKEAFAARPTAGLAQSLANDASTDYEFAGAVGYFRQARQMDPAGASGYTEQILTNMFYGAQSKAFTFAEIAQEADLALASPEATPAQKVELALMLRQVAGQAEDPGLAVPYITAALTASKDGADEELARGRLRLEVDYALLVEKDADKAVALRKRTLPEGWQEDPDQLNGFAWWCFENKVNLEEAADLARRGVELAADDGQRANILDTAAEICAARGDCGDAVALIKRAVELAPDKKYFQDQLARFEAMRAEGC